MASKSFAGHVDRGPNYVHTEIGCGCTTPDAGPADAMDMLMARGGDPRPATPTDFQGELGDLLDWFLGRPKGAQPIEITRAVGKKKYVKDRITALINERVIGEDEPEHIVTLQNAHGQDYQEDLNEQRNQLRAEQRKMLR